MISVDSGMGQVLAIRLEKNDDLTTEVMRAVDHAGFSSAAIVAAAGSLQSLKFGVVSIQEDDVPRYTDVVELDGAIEITGLQGHVGSEVDGSRTFHLHGTFANSDGSVVAGHVYEAKVLVTVEITLIGTTQVQWQRSAEEYASGHTMPILLPSKV